MGKKSRRKEGSTGIEVDRSRDSTVNRIRILGVEGKSNF